MKIAILMPVHNGGDKLIHAVESILEQTYPKSRMRLIMVDNNSTDNAIGEVDERLCVWDNIGNRILNWTLLSCNEPGIVPALNTGLFHILSGDYNYDLIARLDADDTWHPEKIAKQVAFMQAHPEVHILGTQIEQVSPAGASLGNLRHPVTDEEIKQKLLSGHNAIAHPSVVVRPEVFLRTGGYDNMYPIAEDYHLWLKALRWYNFANIDEVLINYTVSHNPSYNPLSPQLACMAAKQAYQRLHGEK